MADSKAPSDIVLSFGFDVVANKPEEFAVYIKSEVEKWGRVIKDAKIPVK